MKRILTHRQYINDIEKRILEHNIFNDKLREKIWNEINSYISDLHYFIEEMPWSLRKGSINNLYIKQLEDLQEQVL